MIGVLATVKSLNHFAEIIWTICCGDWVTGEVGSGDLVTSRPGGAEETDHSQWPASLSEWAVTTDMGSYFLLTYVTSHHLTSHLEQT